MEENSGKKPSTEEVLFVQLVAMFQAAAMQQMGKIINPVTNKIERDLEQARFSIDVLDMLKVKTKGNLTREEETFLDKVLFELHMNYVDEAARAGKESATAGEGAAGEGSAAKESVKKKKGKAKRAAGSASKGGSADKKAGRGK